MHYLYVTPMLFEIFGHEATVTMMRLFFAAK
jgi:hypothetical protein